MPHFALTLSNLTPAYYEIVLFQNVAWSWLVFVRWISSR